jgi:lysophospholipase L1-like esterase
MTQKSQIRIVLFLLLCSLVVNGYGLVCIRSLYGRLLKSQLYPTGIPPVSEWPISNNDSDLRTRILMLGDSRIADWNPLPDLSSAVVSRAGIGGMTSSQLDLLIETAPFSRPPDCVIIQIGINDLKAIGVFPEQREEILNLCEQNIRHIVNHLMKANIKVVFTTIFPPAIPEWHRRLVWSDQIRIAVNELNDRVRQWKYPTLVVIDCDSILKSGDRLNPLYAVGALHINSAGYDKLNRLIEPILQMISSSDR